jgi:uncharacterized protein YdiU (UPF0061 family)
VEHFETHWRERMARRLGVALTPADTPFLNEMNATLGAVETDPTLFFRRLIDLAALPPVLTGEAALVAPLAECFYDAARSPAADSDLRGRWVRWLRDWRARFDADPRPVETRRAEMAAASPAVIPRNWLAQEAIDAAEDGDFAPLERLMEAVRRPYEETSANAHFRQRRPEWARDKAGCSALSCSS